MAWKLPEVVSHIIEGSTRATKTFFEQFASQEGEEVESVAGTLATAAQAAAESAANTQLALKAPLASPALTGTPTGPTAPKGTNSTQLATMAAVQTAAAEAISGLTAHANVAYATVAALPTNTYLSGVLTGTALAALTVDGEAVTVGQRLLVKNEVAEANNGLYVVTHAGGVAEAYVLTRAADMKESAQVEKAYTFVEGGKTLKNSGWFVATPGPFTLGTTGIPWGRLPGSGDLVPGEGITIDGNVVAVSSSVVSRRLKSLGEVTGTVKINLSEPLEGGLPNYFTMKAIGNLVIQFENWPSGIQEPVLEITQDATGGRTIEVTGAVGEPTTPVFNTEPNAVNIIYLLSRNSGTNVWIQTGAQGATGPTGATGPEGPSSIEAMTGLSFPLYHGSGKPSAYTEIGKAFRMEWAMVVVPKKAKKLKLIWYPGETGKGKVRAVVLDTGHAVAEKYTPLAYSGLVEPLVKEKPAILAELTRSSGEWEPGEVLMVGIGAENTAMKLPFGVGGAAGSELLLENAVQVKGIGTLKAPTLLGFSNLTQAEFEAGTFAAIGEGAMAVSASGVTFSCRWE